MPETKSDLVELDISGAVAVLRLNDPNRKNALSQDMLGAIEGALDQVRMSERTQALVLTGSGEAFCAGGDLGAILKRHQDDPDNRSARTYARMQVLQQLLDQVRRLPFPVVMAVDGPAIGAGFGLALAGDFLLATGRSYFCAPFLSLGAVPDCNLAWSLTRSVGQQRAKEILLTGRRVRTAEAVRLGLVLEEHSGDGFLDAACAFAASLPRTSELALSLTRQMVHCAFETGVDGMSELEASAQAACFSTQFHLNSLQVFAARRQGGQ
jgi:2-(1,2-epoxy-1,2-dihydrophenyl)acetyl-CoA isomerase